MGAIVLLTAAVCPGQAPAPDRWPLMRELQGTWPAALMDDERLSVSGWVTASATASTAAVNNQPVVWNDRANEFLLQQAWLRFGRAVATSGTTEPTFGFQVDVLYGSDYRFTLPRGLFNSQLQNANGNINLYGVDPVQHYLNAYVPTLFGGTEFRVGRVNAPLGVESNESVSTPLISRSYTFNFSPFTNSGAAAYVTFDPQWSGVFMAANGNDVYFGDPAEEWRFVGNVKWTRPGGRDTVTFGTSVGRGKFNAAEPYAAATPATATEPTGRNNINMFDLAWTHAIDARSSTTVEGLFGYQTNVPGIANAAGGGTATWAALVHYLFYALTPQLSAVTRAELFDDFQGQRTGFEGLYTAGTVGLVYRPTRNLIIRGETRYDYNVESRPFENRPDLFTAALDVTVRW